MKDQTVKSFRIAESLGVVVRYLEIGVRLDFMKERKLMREGNLELPNTSLCERMLSPYNIAVAVANVKRNNGSPGVDGMTVEDFEVYKAEGHFERDKELILARKYKPQPAKRVEIPKDNGGVRLLGIPTVKDRVIQQMMVQVLQPVFEPTFSDFSYGFRPHRSAEDAVRQAQIYEAQGYKHVVDLDLSKFFDMVNHDLLMTLIDRVMPDKDIRRLIYTYLKAGVMIGDVFAETEQGTPQGGPASPLLSNIYLTPFDKELESRGLKFVRYADDCNIFVKSKYSAKRVMNSAIRFLEGPMKLKVNKEKTEARTFAGSAFLGFEFLEARNEENGLCKCRPRAKRRKYFEDRVREILRFNNGIPLYLTMRQLNSFLRGWVNYFSRSNIKSFLERKMQWVRRRLRAHMWRRWKTAGNRKTKLRKLGVTEKQIEKFSRWSGSHSWRVSMALGKMITNEMLEKGLNKLDGTTESLLDISKIWQESHARKMDTDICVINGMDQFVMRFMFD